jgi:phosphoserine phosphatase
MVQVSTTSQSPGQMRHIFSSMQHPADLVRISTVRQCSLQSGGMVLGIDMDILNNHEDQVLKDLLLNCQKKGYHVMEYTEKKSSGDASWQHLFNNRAVITMVQKPQIKSKSLQAVFGALHQANINVIRIERLSVENLTAMALSVVMPEGMLAKTVKETLQRVGDAEQCDIAFQHDDVDRWMRRLVVFDMDSTLIQQEVIDELAKYAGVEKQVSEITEKAMNGELDFFGSLKARVALLAGHNAEELFSRVKKNLVFTPGAKRLCSTLKKLGYKMAVISGGFLPVAEEVQKHLGLDYAFANTLDIDEATGLLTGKTAGPVVTPQRKRALLATISNVEGCSVSQTIAVGDGANDIPMLHTAGLGIAFCAKPKVQAVSEFRINQKDLSTVMFLIGVSEHAARKLAVDVSEEDLAREAQC